MKTGTRPHLTVDARRFRRSRLWLIAFSSVVFVAGITLLPDVLRVNAARQKVARQNVSKGAATTTKPKSSGTTPAPEPPTKAPVQQVQADGSIVGTPVALSMGASETVADIMVRESMTPPQKLEPAETDLERAYPSRK